MSGRGSTGNVLAALASFFIPGLGQLVQGRLWKAFLHLVVTGLLWLVWLGWVGHLWSAYDAAVWHGRT
jgi:TM2 domain-containing membrane protein YozV